MSEAPDLRGAKHDEHMTAAREGRELQDQQEVRTARVTGARTRKELDAYLPGNYATVVTESYPADDQSGVIEDYDGRPVQVAIVGIDVAGWTLDGYVIPRLASGLIWAEEVTA